MLQESPAFRRTCVIYSCAHSGGWYSLKIAQVVCENKAFGSCVYKIPISWQKALHLQSFCIHWVNSFVYRGRIGFLIVGPVLEQRRSGWGPCFNWKKFICCPCLSIAPWDTCSLSNMMLQLRANQCWLNRERARLFFLVQTNTKAKRMHTRVWRLTCKQGQLSTVASRFVLNRFVFFWKLEGVGKNQSYQNLMTKCTKWPQSSEKI